MPNQNNLTPFTAKDTQGGTVHIQGKVDPSLKLWIKSLPGSTSFHVRQALRLYKIWMMRKAGDWEHFEQECRSEGLI